MDDDAIARAHGFSLDAVSCLRRALAAGRGMAQFSHPELGGLGQWAGGDMTMIGEMGNPALRRRVGALCVALSARPMAADSQRPAWTPPRVTEGRTARQTPQATDKEAFFF